jgi:glycine cleavage system T protein (aminomethyltransferase)
MKHTPLYDQHVRDASTVINLKGFARAMQYRGHAAEHRATRQHVSLCDVSHMGELDFRGADALALVQKLITNDAGRLAVDRALYSVMCDERGIVIDDLVCYRLAADHFVWVVNVTKTDEDYQWVLKHAQGMDVKVSNVSTDTALLALQGPESREVLQRIARADLSTLKYYWLAQTAVHTRHAEVPCIISRTGYTGERGYEIMVARDLAPWVWDELLMAGRPLGIEPQGVAARESLRTEAGYLLNGNDMDAQTNPIEAGLEWVVRFSKDFIGREALARIKTQGVGRKLVGLEVQGHRTVRNGYPIYANGKQVGQVTSGPLSPALSGRNLGLGYVATEHARAGTELEVSIGDRKSRARVVAAPFCPRRVKEEPAVRTFSPFDLRFSESHAWARPEEGAEDVVVIGLSDFGQRILGDILCVDLPKVGDRVTKGSAAAWVDSYRRPFDIVSPVTGAVVEVSESLVQHPERINAYPYARTGLLQIRADTARETDTLMRFEDYAALIQRMQRYDEWFKDRRMT